MDQDFGPDPKEEKKDLNFAKIKCQIFHFILVFYHFKIPKLKSGPGFGSKIFLGDPDQNP